MPIFCVSDLHLCDRGYRDNFAVEGREARFYEFLDYVEANGSQLCILGDLFDWWQSNLSKSVFAYRDLLVSPRWLDLAAKGASPQRLLWASTGTKDPHASDTRMPEA